jgi:anti-sigma regulatory factor (Ser/Thr protein kinase)
VLLFDQKRRRVYACSFGQFRPRYLSPEDSWVELVCPVYPPLGLSTANEFAVSVVPLAIGKAWILLTDGFIEARDAAGSQFGESALEDALRASNKNGPNLLETLEERWREFSKGGADRDDATAMLIVDKSIRPESSLTCEISPETIPDLRHFCEQWVAFAGFDDAGAYQLVLAFDEVLTNVFKHAYAARPGPVSCTANMEQECLRLVVQHWGDGLSSAEEIPKALDSSRPGGYGLPFIHRVFDGVMFSKNAEFATVTLSKRIEIARKSHSEAAE